MAIRSSSRRGSTTRRSISAARDIVVTGSDPNDPKIVGYTIINADGDGSAVTFENGETPAAVLTGFTITGGFGTLNNSIEGQSAGGIFWGAGIYCINASPTITKNIIARNYGPTDADWPGRGQLRRRHRRHLWRPRHHL